MSLEKNKKEKMLSVAVRARTEFLLKRKLK